MHLLYSNFLWGLLAVGIPVAIHLLQLRRPQRVLFTNLGFIREVEMTTVRRRRLQELLVLLMRVLAVIAVVLLFCQPFIPVATGGTSSVSGVVDVLVDNSGSMQVTGQTQSLKQEAAIGAVALSQGYGANTRFKILGQRGGAVSRDAYTLALVEQQSSGRQVGWGNPSVQEVLQDEKQGALYLFSDFQKNEVKPDIWRRVRRTGEVVLVPLVAPASGNIYVDSVWLNDAFVRERTNIGLHIRLRNGGAEAVAACPVKVMLGARQVATLQTTIGARQAKEIVVQIQLPDNKLALGQVVTGDAPVTFDNTYHFTLQPAAAIRVVEIGTVPVTQQAYAHEPLFIYRFAKLPALNYEEIRRANLVLLQEVPQVDAGLRDALVEVTQRGGSVVVVPSASPATHTTYHELFKALGVGGEQWQTPAITTREEVAVPNPRDPFFREVLGAQAQRATMPQVAPVVRLGRGGTDILRLCDGDGFLTEFASGRGRTYVFAAPFAKDYSDFTAHALFVPVLYRLAMLSYRTEQRPAYRLGAATVVVAVPPGAAGTNASDATSYRLVRDSLTYIPAQRVQSGQLHLEVPADLTVSGFYQLTKQGRVITTLAFNAPKRESELAAYSVAEMRQLLGADHPNVRVLEQGAQPELLARYQAGQTSRPLWRYCLLLALGCLLAEGLLLRFGRPRVGRSQAVG